jgi:hypothetical protein
MGTSKKKRKYRSSMGERHKTSIYFSGCIVKKAFKNRLLKDLPIYNLDTLQLAYIKNDNSWWLEYMPQTLFWHSSWFEIPATVGVRLMKSWEALEK